MATRLPRAGRILLGAFLTLTALPAQAVTQTRSVETWPAFDLGYAEADLVVIGSPKGFAGDRIPIAIHLVLKGRVETGTLPVVQPRSYGLHVRLPAKASPHLLFLKKTPAGYIPLQRSGILVSVPKASRRERALHAFFKLLARAEAFKGKSTTKGMDTLCRDVSRFATSHTLADPLLAQAALLTLARRPDLAPQMPASERKALHRLLDDPKQDPTLRDLTSRCLAAAKDPKLPDHLLQLLGQGRAEGLGSVFGRLLASRAGSTPLNALANAYKKAAPRTRREIRKSLDAFRGPAAHELRMKLK